LRLRWSPAQLLPELPSANASDFGRQASLTPEPGRHDSRRKGNREACRCLCSFRAGLLEPVGVIIKQIMVSTQSIRLGGRTTKLKHAQHLSLSFAYWLLIGPNFFKLIPTEQFRFLGCKATGRGPEFEPCVARGSFKKEGQATTRPRPSDGRPLTWRVSTLNWGHNSHPQWMRGKNPSTHLPGMAPERTCITLTSQLGPGDRRDAAKLCCPVTKARLPLTPRTVYLNFSSGELIAPM
jgi:hypothetical protein